MDLGDQPVAKGDHLGDGHPVVGDLQREEVVEAHRRATLFRRSRSRSSPSRNGRPIVLDASQAARVVEVARLDEDAVDVVGRDG